MSSINDFQLSWNKSAKSPKELEASLLKALTNGTSYDYFKGVVAALAAQAADVVADALDYKVRGTRVRADKVDRDVDVWFRDRWWDRANVVATDFFLSNDLVDVAKEVNLKRAICTKAGQGFRLANDEASGSQKEDSVTEIGLNGLGSGDWSAIDADLDLVHRQIGERLSHNMKAMGRR